VSTQTEKPQSGFQKQTLVRAVVGRNIRIVAARRRNTTVGQRAARRNTAENAKGCRFSPFCVVAGRSSIPKTFTAQNFSGALFNDKENNLSF